MKTVHYSFVWLNKPVSDCLTCGGKIHVDEVQLVLRGTLHEAVFSGHFGRCIQCRCWYGLLKHMDEMLSEIGWKSHDIEELYINEKQLTIGAWLGPNIGLMSWKELMLNVDKYKPDPTSPPPDVATVRALDLLPENWEIGISVGDWVAETEGDPELSYVAVVVDGLGIVRHFLMQAGEPQRTDQLVELIFEAAIRPRAEVAPGRPQMLYLKNETMADVLAKRLAEVDIQVEVGPTPMLDAAFEAMLTAFRKTTTSPFLIDYSEETVRDYFQAARAFYRARPWMRFEGTKYIGAKIGNERWRYFNIMGQAGEEPGLTFFEDWLQICLFIQNYEHQSADPNRPFRAAGALEGVSLMPSYALHPVDADYLIRLGIKPVKRHYYPVPHRYLPDPSAQENPVFDLSLYGKLMQGIVDVLASRRAFRITSINKTVTVDGTSMAIRYPANAKETFEEHPGAYRIIIEGVETHKKPGPLPPGTRIEIDASGDQRTDKVAWALKRSLGKNFEVEGFYSGSYFIWSSASERATATPRVAHLVGMKDLELSIGLEKYPMRVMRRVGTVPADLLIRRVP